MDNKILIKDLCNLAQLDIDAIRAYAQALDNIDHATIHTQISSFKADHDRHVNDLSAVIRRLGGEPPDFSPDLKGFFIEGFTAIRSMTGTEGALKAMRSNEKLTNRTYEKALGWEMPADIRAIVDKNFADEKRHLAYIEQAIETKAWEKTSV
ncbi:MAG: ferritin [Gammaproteobacteria bacterium]|jgi:uncharacterized protein (TIGR02284 family)|nr:ferritin [Gammaproteobacteria bacterium]